MHQYYIHLVQISEIICPHKEIKLKVLKKSSHGILDNYSINTTINPKISAERMTSQNAVSLVGNKKHNTKSRTKTSTF